jgi:hypothetical protein
MRRAIGTWSNTSTLCASPLNSLAHKGTQHDLRGHVYLSKSQKILMIRLPFFEASAALTIYQSKVIQRRFST